MDNEIENMIMTQYDKHPLKMGYFRNKWKAKCKMEATRSNQLWPEKEVNVRSIMHTLKTNANPILMQSSRKKHKLTETAFRKMEDKDREISTAENITMQIREEEHEDIKEFENKMPTEERGEAFDKSVLEQIGTDIEKLEAALATIAKEQDYIIEKKDKTLIQSIMILFIDLTIKV